MENLIQERLKRIAGINPDRVTSIKDVPVLIQWQKQENEKEVIIKAFKDFSRGKGCSCSQKCFGGFRGAKLPYSNQQTIKRPA